MTNRITSALTLRLLLFCCCGLSPCLAETPGASAFAGDTYCEACHREAAESFASNVHAKGLLNQANVCETCHGAGRRHALSMNAEHIMNPGAMEGPQAVAACKNCHGGMPHPWDKGKTAREYHCVNCHQVHAANEGQ